MPNRNKFILLLLLPLIVMAWTSPSAFAQGLPGEKPVMESVFYNVFWGAATGALLGAAGATTAARTKNAPENLREQMIQGATLGSVAGLAIGVWLVFNGVTFDPNRSLIFGGAIPLANAEFPPNDYTAPIIFLTEAPNDPSRITGIQALVYHLKF